MEYLQLSYIVKQQQDKKMEEEFEAIKNVEEPKDAPDKDGPVLGEDGEI
jgi:hypothetical protein